MGRYPSAIWSPSPNFWPGRGGRNPQYIIVHGTAGGANASSVGWLDDTASKVSAHYVITQAGQVYQLVDDINSAWANGIITAGHDAWWSTDVNPNLITLSIEHEKPDQYNNTGLTAAQALASFQLISWLCQRWNIPARPADSSGGVTGHYSIDPVDRSHCPGVYPWSGLWQYLAQTNGDDLKMLSLSDPMGKFFTDLGNNRWHCNNNKIDIAYAHLDFYRKYEGVFGLPLTNEMYLSQLPGTSIQIYERAIAIYDPKHVNEGSNPATTIAGGSCYLMRIDKGIAQQIIAKSLVSDLQNQVKQLQAQIAKQPATSQADIDALNKQLASYKQALEQVKETLASL
jgi:hypothetical protein